MQNVPHVNLPSPTAARTLASLWERAKLVERETLGGKTQIYRACGFESGLVVLRFVWSLKMESAACFRKLLLMAEADASKDIPLSPDAQLSMCPYAGLFLRLLLLKGERHKMCSYCIGRQSHLL